jgi:hypothetical protein
MTVASHWVSSSEASNSWSDPDSLSITSKCSLDIDGRGLVHERRLRRIAKINTWITQCHLGREPVTESDLAHLIEVLGDRLCLWSRAVHHCVRTQPRYHCLQRCLDDWLRRNRVSSTVQLAIEPALHTLFSSRPPRLWGRSLEP